MVRLCLQEAMAARMQGAARGYGEGGVIGVLLPGVQVRWHGQGGRGHHGRRHGVDQDGR